MKAIVKEVFIDKYTGVVHSINELLDFDDERISDLEKRKLVEVVREEPEKPAPKRRKKASS